MCEDCKNYEKVEPVKQKKMDCFKNKCESCACKACADFAECDSTDKKCSYCKYRPTHYWSVGTGTVNYNWPYDMGTAGTINPCEYCSWTLKIKQDGTYVGDVPCNNCPHNPHKIICSNTISLDNMFPWGYTPWW